MERHGPAGRGEREGETGGGRPRLLARARLNILNMTTVGVGERRPNGHPVSIGRGCRGMWLCLQVLRWFRARRVQFVAGYGGVRGGCCWLEIGAGAWGGGGRYSSLPAEPSFQLYISRGGHIHSSAHSNFCIYPILLIVSELSRENKIVITTWSKSHDPPNVTLAEKAIKHHVRGLQPAFKYSRVFMQSWTVLKDNIVFVRA